MTPEPLFVQDGGVYIPAEMTRGPWDPGALHGGAPAALFAHALAAAEPAQGLRLARLTCEFVRPVPLVPLEVLIEIVRPGQLAS